MSSDGASFITMQALVAHIYMGMATLSSKTIALILSQLDRLSSLIVRYLILPVWLYITVFEERYMPALMSRNASGLGAAALMNYGVRTTGTNMPIKISPTYKRKKKADEKSRYLPRRSRSNMLQTVAERAALSVEPHETTPTYLFFIFAAIFLPVH